MSLKRDINFLLHKHNHAVVLKIITAVITCSFEMAHLLVQGYVIKLPREYQYGKAVCYENSIEQFSLTFCSISRVSAPV